MYEKSIFLITYGRTGSTLLTKILNTIPEAIIRGENSNLLFNIFHTYKNCKKIKQFGGPLAKTPSGPWYGATMVDCQKFRENLVNVFIEDILCPEKTTKIIGFKEIRYFDIPTYQEFKEYLDFINSSFPNAHFIFNSRNFDDVTQSSWWKKWDKVKLIKRLKIMDDWFSRYIKENRNNCLPTTYEDFTQDEKQIARIFSFLKEQPDFNEIRKVLNIPLKHGKPKK